MADPKQIQDVVQRVVGETFDSYIPELRNAVMERVMEEITPLLGASSGSSSAMLDAAVSSVQDGVAQADILRSLVEGASKFAGRVALLVLRGGTLTGWQARGFNDNDAIKSVTLDPSRGLAGRAITDHTPAGAAAAEFDSNFVSKFGNPADGNALVLPLVVRDKVPAVVYADAGTADPKLDAPSLQLLVRSTGMWLELISLRRAASTAGIEADGTPPAGIPASIAAAAAATAPPPAPVETASPPPPVPAAAPAISAEDEEIHKKAKRFAKLLVDEIKLYNQGKVTEGRKSKDLYDRLKDDIDKSRATYDKRYGSTAAASADYFSQEVIRILADSDVSLLGSNFRSS